MRLPRLPAISLKTRVVLAVALLFISFAGLLTWLALHHVNRNFRTNLYQEQFVLASTLAAAIDNKLRQAQEMLAITARQVPRPALDDADRAQSFLDEHQALQQIFTNGLALVSERGRVIAESPFVAGRRGQDISSHDAYRVVSQTRKPHISKPFASDRAQGRPAITLSVPLFADDGRPAGRLHGSIELDGPGFLSELSDIRIGRTGYVSLFTRDRIFISNRNPERILKPIVAPGLNPLVDRAVDGFEGSGTTMTSRGEEVVSSFKHLQMAPWLLSVSLPVAEAEEVTMQARSILLVAVGAGTLLALVLIGLVMRSALRPLETLTRHVLELPGRPPGQRQLSLPRRDEIGTLVQAFNRLVVEVDQQQQSLRDSETRFRNLAELSTDWFWEQDEQFRFTDVSQGFKRSVMTPLLGKARWEQPVLAPDEAGWEAHRQVLQRHEPFRDFVYQLRGDDGQARTMSISGAPVFDADGRFRGYRGVGTDITARKAAEQRIEYLAYHDELTGLPNRLLVQDRFEQAVAQADRTKTCVALVYLDLDNFKVINDTLGHAAGDAFLQEVARRLRAGLRDTDTISRQGGDEFLIVLRDLPDADAVSGIVLKLMDQLAAPVQIGSHEASSSASVGVALCPQDGHDFETIRKKADLAMYRSKESGRNVYHFFDPTMDAEAGEHLAIRNGLRRALERGEFVLHYQPQYKLGDGRLTGVEALLRWQHPGLGLVPPGRFIGVAEESGLIVPIGDWVIHEACRQGALWQRAGAGPLTISVNLSAIQFKRGAVEKTVSAALQASGLPPALLELELTESILIQQVEGVLASVRQLKQLGVKLAIDDFGTGYSSLSYLKRFEVDRLKIDQSFVRDLTTDENDAAIVRAIIQMAQSLNLQTIAEGVETPEALDQLRALGCDEAQGFHFARPMPAMQMEQLLHSQG